MSFSLENGNITVSQLESNTDYNFTIKDTGDITFDQVATKSKAYINVKNGNVALKQMSCVLFEGVIETGNLHCSEENPGQHFYDLSCENGMVYLLGESQGNKYVVDTGSDTSKIDFSVKFGNIHLNELEKTAP